MVAHVQESGFKFEVRFVLLSMTDQGQSTTSSVLSDPALIHCMYHQGADHLASIYTEVSLVSYFFSVSYYYYKTMKVL